MLKRTLDLFVSATTLIVMLLPLLLLALIIKLSLGGPVFFKQLRPGLNSKPFLMIKFRTMTNQCLPNGDLMPDSMRMTRIGKLLRETSIDELPTFWNVLRGDMSLVGPRPLLMEYLPLYNKKQARRNHVLPGITGLAQVNGRNALTWEEKFDLDVWYVDNQNMLLDFKIIFKTLRKVIAKEGITTQGGLTMPHFKGSGSDSED